MISPNDAALKWIIEKGLANKSESAKKKVKMLKVKFELNINGVIEEIVYHGKGGPAT